MTGVQTCALPIWCYWGQGKKWNYWPYKTVGRIQCASMYKVFSTIPETQEVLNKYCHLILIVSLDTDKVSSSKLSMKEK